MPDGKEGGDMKKSLMNNISLKLLAFFAAFLLWLVVVNIDDPITDKKFNNIPVVVEHEEILTKIQQSYQIVDNTQAVSVTVRAKRSVLNKISAADIIASADMKELYLESQIPIEIAITGYEDKFESATSDPRNLQVEIEENISKKFSITPVASGTVREDFMLGEMTATPEKISINGPQSVINRISKVAAEADVSGLAADSVLKATIILYDADNNVIDQSLLGNNPGNFSVNVNVKLLHTAYVPVILDESGVMVEDGYSIASIAYEPKEIQIAAEDSLLQQITSIDIPADELEGDEISAKTERTIDITPYIPAGAKLVEENGSNIIVTITVQKAGTKSFDLPVGSITVKNLDEKFKVSYSITEDLEIKVRGPQEVLNTIVIGKSASVDLKELTAAGKYKVPVKVELPVGCTLEGAVEVEIVLEEKKSIGG